MVDEIRRTGLDVEPATPSADWIVELNSARSTRPQRYRALIDVPEPTFAALGVSDPLVVALRARSITSPSPIQVLTIPDALTGLDVAAEAPTGSGKTIAYGLPLLQLVSAARSRTATSLVDSAVGAAPARPSALVVAPTRELARQILHTLEPLAVAVGLEVHGFHGGVPFEPQIAALRRGIDVAVACPGRLLDLVDQGYADLGGITIAVIDEADRLADLGFLPDVTRLLQRTPSGRQTMLFSATLSGPVEALIDAEQRSPVRHAVIPSELTPVRHHFWVVDGAARGALLADVVEHCGATIAFSNTRRGADLMADQLGRLGVKASVLHGGNVQLRRRRALDGFTAGDTQVLVATDVAARGLHIDDVACVVHLDLPTDPSEYVHRSGRTGRAGAAGTVVAFVDPDHLEGAKRLVHRVCVSFAGDILGDAEFCEPDVGMLEGTLERIAINRELAALDQLTRPGAVGAVRFSLRG